MVTEVFIKFWMVRASNNNAMVEIICSTWCYLFTIDEMIDDWGMFQHENNSFEVCLYL